MWLKLTKLNGLYILINTKNIITFEGETSGTTKINTNSELNSNLIFVKETVSQIEKTINNREGIYETQK